MSDENKFQALFNENQNIHFFQIAFFCFISDQKATFLDVDGLEPGVSYVFQVRQKFICRNPASEQESDLSSDPVWTGPVLTLPKAGNTSSMVHFP